MTVKMIKLVTGQDILTEVKKEFDDVLTLKNPVLIGIIPTREGPGINLMDWLMLSESKEKSIKKDHCILIDDPPVELLNIYNENFGSGIVLAHPNQMPRQSNQKIAI